MNLKLALISMAMIFAANAQADITVYTDRQAARFAGAATEFEKQTGQKVVFVEAPYKDILLKLNTEGKTTPADLVITKDLVYLSELTRLGLLKSIAPSKALTRVAPHMRGDNNEWVAITFRVRSVVYDPAQGVNPADLKSYEDVGKFSACLRTSKAAYNEALVANLLVTHGEAKTRQIVDSWLGAMEKTNLPQVKTDDTKVLEAIAAGECQVGIVNHYYLAGKINQDPTFSVKMAFVDQVHNNGTGVGMVSASGKDQLAQTFIDILLSEKVQLEVSAAHFDYPAVQGLQPSTFIKEWGTFKMSEVPWSQVGAKASEARKLMDELGYL